MKLILYWFLCPFISFYVPKLDNYFPKESKKEIENLY